jgi:hypothetical protein
VRIKGVTRRNILGSDGGCESLAPFTSGGSGTDELSTTHVKSGTYSIKFTTSSQARYRYKDYSYPLDTLKQYFAGAWVYIESVTGSPLIGFDMRDNGSLANTRYSAYANNAIVGSWQFVYLKIPTANTFSGTGFSLLFGVQDPSTSAVAYIDEIRLFEVSTTDYTAIGATITASTTPSIDDVFPYCDSCQHLKNPILTAAGKNQLGASPDTIHANAVLTAPYELTHNATAGFQDNTFSCDAIPGKSYTFSATLGGYVSFTVKPYLSIIFKNAAGTTLDSQDYLPSADGRGSATLAAPTGTTEVFAVMSNVGTGTFTYSDWQLELGSEATPFVEANPSYLYGVADINGNPIKLASNVDGSVRDEMYQQGNQSYALRRFKLDLPLSGFTWAYADDATGYKRVTVTTSQLGPSYVNNTQTIVKYDGQILANVSTIAGMSGADQSVLNLSESSSMHITIDDDDSGWGEDYTSVSADEAKAMIEYGWKMNNGTFGTNYNGTGTKTWTPYGASNNDDAVTVCPTTLATGYPGYKLSYQLAQTAEPEAVQVEGALSIPSGGAQIKLAEGVIVREPVTPYHSGDVWVINSVDSSAYLDNRSNQIIKIHRSLDDDDAWTIFKDYGGSGTANGGANAIIDESDYDDTKQYYATYIALDKYNMTANATDAEIEYQTSDHSVMVQMVHKQADIETNVSIALNALVELYAEVEALKNA